MNGDKTPHHSDGVSFYIWSLVEIYCPGDQYTRAAGDTSQKNDGGCNDRHDRNNMIRFLNYRVGCLVHINLLIVLGITQ
jgi:hypothetical protein